MPPRGSRRKPPVINRNTKVGADVDLDREDVRLPDGTRLTNRVAESINVEIRRKAGRPPLSASARRSPSVSTRIPPDQMKELKRYSKTAGMTVSDVLRQALDQFMKSGGKVRR
jgi:Ribbon-helix-helix domain